MGSFRECVWGLLWATLILGSNAFLPTKLNYSDPDINALLCPDQMTEDTWDLKVFFSKLTHQYTS